MVGLQICALALAALGGVAARGMPRPTMKPAHLIHGKVEARSIYPVNVNDYKAIVTSRNVTIRYKEPDGSICESTPGVKTYTGYVEVGPGMHSFFWFFESRRDPANDDVTLWLNGGPGSDSMIGLFQELGPCRITKDLKAKIAPYAWNEVSNMIFLSQPYGVGFSYEGEGKGSFNRVTGVYQNASQGDPIGRWPLLNVTSLDTTDLAAAAAYDVIQGFYSGLNQMDSKIKPKEVNFNLWTESYGGHYGPAFFSYFYKENLKVIAGTQHGRVMRMNSLGIGNGIINEEVQAEWYPEFAVNNTYGIKSYNDTIYTYAQIALRMPTGCLDLISFCNAADRSTLSGKAICTEAANMCRDNVEGVYYNFGNRGVYDIRHPRNDPTPPTYYTSYLNLPEVQQAIGVNLNYTQANNDIYWAFQQTGDFVYPTFLDDLAYIVDQGVAVNLFYGDADYICNWFGGQALSQKVKYKGQKQFLKSGYTPFMVDGTEYGETRQYGNFSFTRIYEAGHEVPFYQAKAALALFNRTISGYDIATGTKVVTADLITNGDPQATHTEPFVPLPTKTAAPGGAKNRKAGKPRIIDW